MEDDISIKEIFSKEGCLNDILPFYEHRNTQLEMAVFIDRILWDAKNAIIEAGTGTGKTLAYLIPLLKFALENDRKVAVTTETKALQKQLLDKDIPAAEQILKHVTDYEPKIALCLGSSNYPCVSRYEFTAQKGSFLFEEKDYMAKVKDLLDINEVFTFEDADVPWTFWMEINREPESCHMRTCRYKSRCIYCKARNEWNKADLLIMNHYLFFANLKTGKTYLPHFDSIVFDEAHSVERIASSQMGFELNQSVILDIKKRVRKGKKSTIFDKIDDENLVNDCLVAYKKFEKESPLFLAEIKKSLGDQNTVRFKSGFSGGAKFLDIIEILYKNIEKCEKHFENDEGLKIEYDSLRARLFNLYQNLSLAVNGYEEKWVYWTENGKAGDSLLGQPIDIKDIMKNEVLGFYESVIFTSATLSVNNSFIYISERFGIFKPEGLLLGSPFDYKKNCTLLLPETKNTPTGEKYVEYLSEIIELLAKREDGKTLVLFTSYKMLGQCKEILEDSTDFDIYAQGEESAAKVITKFIDNSNSILMGTHSFWQGIDLQGDILKNVVIARLPFDVPDLPVVEAKSELVSESGKNPFVEYQLPEAVLKLKQGFGRLIRSGNDSGIVAIVDNRITTKSYGKFFLNSLPECSIVKNIDDLELKNS